MHTINQSILRAFALFLFYDTIRYHFPSPSLPHTTSSDHAPRVRTPKKSTELPVSVPHQTLVMEQDDFMQFYVIKGNFPSTVDNYERRSKYTRSRRSTARLYRNYLDEVISIDQCFKCRYIQPPFLPPFLLHPF